MSRSASEASRETKIRSGLALEFANSVLGRRERKIVERNSRKSPKTMLRTESECIHIGQCPMGFLQGIGCKYHVILRY